MSEQIHVPYFFRVVAKPPSFFYMETGQAILFFALNWLMHWDQTSLFTF
jgi:hypothetical protein